jgi:hypothetical protein
MVILNMSVAFGQGQPVSHEKVAGIFLSKMSEQEEQVARAFVTVLNNTPRSFAVTENMKLVIDWDVLSSAEPSDI